MVWLSDPEKKVEGMITCFGTIQKRDGRTDRHTARRHIRPSLRIASRGNKANTAQKSCWFGLYCPSLSYNIVTVFACQLAATDAHPISSYHSASLSALTHVSAAEIGREVQVHCSDWRADAAEAVGVFPGRSAAPPTSNVHPSELSVCC